MSSSSLRRGAEYPAFVNTTCGGAPISTHPGENLREEAIRPAGRVFILRTPGRERT
ncbi:hypothetical protein GS506_16145 [Rhodococcus hoagii]|nr:hypothetical protein [Prescottella equi]